MQLHLADGISPRMEDNGGTRHQLVDKCLCLSTNMVIILSEK